MVNHRIKIAKKINLSTLHNMVNEDMFILFRPFGSKLFRCPKIPSYLVKDKEKCIEVEQVLNTICTANKHGVWYFRSEEKDNLIILEIFYHMDIFPYLVEPDQSFLN